MGSPPFGRPYSGDPVVVSPPPPTKMFPFGGFPSGTPIPPPTRGRGMVSRTPRALRPWQEVPFGDPGFNGCMRLPRAYRSLPRPSSAPEPSHPPGGVGAAGPGTRGGAPARFRPVPPIMGVMGTGPLGYLSMARIAPINYNILFPPRSPPKYLNHRGSRQSGARALHTEPIHGSVLHRANI